MRSITILKQVLFLGVLWTALLGGCKDESNSPSNSIYGTPGPAGGVVFYDKGFYSNGWRYMEITPFSIGNANWGCLNQDLPMCSETAIGTGLENSDHILVAQADTTPCYSVPTAAKLCGDYTLNGYSDWFLPSTEELTKAVETLIPLNVGGFYSYEQIWTSTEGSGSWWDGTSSVHGCHAHRVEVLIQPSPNDNSDVYETSKTMLCKVRAVRRY